MGTWYTERGVVVGARWARSIVSPTEVRSLLVVLDRMIEANLWDYRLVHADISRIRSSAAGNEVTTAHADQAALPAAEWWSETGGSHWPENEEDRASFAKGFVFGAALEIRDSQLT